MLSIIVPAYNEEKTLEITIRALRDFLGGRGWDFELIVVDDGSRDKTFRIAKSLESERVRAFSLPQNKGKGHALKFGFEKSRGDKIIFFDSGLDFPPSQLANFFKILEGADVVVGSKRHSESKVGYPWHRRLVSFGAQLLVKALFDLGVTDTQVGLKVFRRRVLEKIMPLVLVKRYAFDIELLALARHHNFVIKEAPVVINLGLSTAVSFKSLWRTFLDTLAVFYRLKIMKFYDKTEAERRRLLAEYPTGFFDRLLCFVLGDVLGRS